MKTTWQRRIPALFLLLALLFTCSGCEPPEGMYASGGSDLPEVEAVPFTIWCPDEILGMVTEQVNAYTTMHSDVNFQIVVEAKSLEDAKAALLADPLSAAEVFAFSSADITELVKANVFSLVSRDKPNIMSDNSAGSVSAAKPEEWMYGYPYAVESEYVLVYDKNLYSAEDAASLDALFSGAEKAGKQVYLNLSDGSGLLSLFLGAGCKLGYNRNGRPVCDFDSDAGTAAFSTVQAIAQNKARTESDFLSGLGKNIAAGIVSSDLLEDAHGILGSDFAVSPLPGYQLNGEAAQMYSAGQYTLFGLRRMLDVDLAPYIMDFCYYLTGADNQLALFNQSGRAITNLAAMENPDFLLSESAAALSLQSRYSTPLYQIPAGYWDAAEVFAAALPNAGAAEAEAMLTEFCTQSLS